MEYRVQSLVLVTLLVTGGVAFSSEEAEHGEQPASVITEPLVRSPGPIGCVGTIQIDDLSTGRNLETGVKYSSPGRLAVDWDRGLILSVQIWVLWMNERDPTKPPWSINYPIVYTMWPQENTRREWNTGYYYSNNYGITTAGAIAVLHDDDAMLLSTVKWRPAPNWDNAPTSGINVLANTSPFHVRKLSIPAYPRRPTDLGKATDSFETDGAVAEIELSRDQTVAHIVTEEHVVYSLSTDTLTEIAPSIDIPPITGLVTSYLNTTIAYLRADLSPDDRYLVVNQGRTGKLTLVDLQARTARTLELDPPMAITGGVAINGGWENRGRLAVHGHNRVALYDFDPTSSGPLREIASAPIAPPSLNSGSIYMAIAWNAKGDKLVAATAQGRGNEGVAVFSVEGDQLKRLDTSLGCGYHNADIWAGNREIGPSPTTTLTPSVTPTPTITPTPTDTPTPTTTASATATPTATPSSTSTPTATRVPKPIYLPLALHERCEPGQQRIDMALVLDASTSMADATRGGRPKIEAAIEAASAFLDLLALDDDAVSGTPGGGTPSLGGDQAAIVAFNADAWVLAPLTDDRTVLDAALEAVALAPQTRLDRAVAVGAEALADLARRRSGNQPVLVLLTDGRANPVPIESAVAEADAAKAAGVTVFTIGLGEDLDADGLAAMASTAERFLRAPDAEDLAAAYAEVARSIPCPASAWWGGR